MEKSISSKQEQPITGAMSSEEQEAYFDELAELTNARSIPTMIIDSNLVIRYMTKSVYTLLAGYYALEKKPLFNVFGRVFTQAEIKDFFESIRSPEKGWSWIGNMVHKSHTLKTLYTRVRVHPIFDRDNRYLLGYWVIIEDVTAEQTGMYKMMLNGLLEASMLKDNDTGNHAQRLNFYCREFSEYLFGLNRYPQINQDFVDNISVLAAIHDVGKIGTPDYILQKQSKLTGIEWEVMKEHTINGALIVSSYPIAMAKEITLSHHERWDGSGYPFKLEGEMIPLSARIVAIADVYDALRMKRSYKSELSHDEAVQYIFENAGKHFDPQLVAYFKEIHHAFDKVWHTLKDDETEQSRVPEDRAVV
ncbi:HD-GYP domain-containing protein [Treponema sp. OMZ 855]|uniref:HD-GYP domain-containing protein n=1 Tax=Treponema sp. OMZ 855 TaxID=1643512 RepID=UPI0020A2F4F2|nr:HD-GYP domain-containing protein [Treponema sp. OMZ 855]UTC51199.1 HD-GYP domain-containing protein [Treponema sp. OMZ 855]